MKMRSFLNAADDTLTRYLGQSAFEHSLLTNLLFQDQILVDEAFLWNSSLLEGHIRRGQQGKVKPSLFQRAATKGLIVPFSYDGPVGNMAEVRHRLTERYGKEYQFAKINPAIQKIISTSIDEGLRGNQEQDWNLTTRSLFSATYLENLRSTLQHHAPPTRPTKAPSASDLNTRAVWPITAKWRYECIEKAAQRTQDKGITGVQRAELFNTLGHELGLSLSDRGITASSLIEETSRSRGEIETQALEAFLRWATQIHQLTRSQMTNIEANLPVYDIDQDYFIDSLSGVEDERGDALMVPLNLPPSEWLFTEGVDRVLEVREAYGEEMLAAVRALRDDSSKANRERVLDCAETYGNHISDRCPVPAVSYWKVIFQTASIVTGVTGLVAHPNLPDLHTISGILEGSRDLTGLGAIPSAASSLRKYYQQRRQTSRQRIWHELTISK